MVKFTEATRRCKECQKPIPETMRVGAQFDTTACKMKDYRRKVKLNHDSMYRRIDKDHVILSVNENRMNERTCSGCGNQGMINCGKTGGRIILVCPGCWTAQRVRSE